jgi:hypothetical protein
LAAFALPASAAEINHGTYIGDDVTFHDVKENNSWLALSPTNVVTMGSHPFVYGAPTVSGNGLLFSSTAFGVTTGGGGSELLDGTLTTRITSQDGGYLSQLQWIERGDYTLAGAGTVASYVTVSAAMLVRIEQVNGVAIAPVTVNPTVNFVPSNGDFFMPLEAGLAVPWAGSALVDLDAILANLNIVGHATQVTFSIDNVLYGHSEAGTVALIKKKQGEIGLEIVPEPSSIALAGLGMLALLGWRMRRR